MEDELVKIWQSSPNQERIKFDQSRLMLEVQSGIDRFERMVKYRDLREMIGAVIVIPAFAIFAYKTPHVLSKAGAVFIVLWAIYVLIRLRNARKQKPASYQENYVAYLRQNREHLNAQKNLLNTVLYWYIIPCLIGTTTILVGFFLESGNFGALIRTEVLFVLTGVLIYFLNKRAVKKTLVPRLEKIEELLEVMEKQ